jgi:hypothetical protein
LKQISRPITTKGFIRNFKWVNKKLQHIIRVNMEQWALGLPVPKLSPTKYFDDIRSAQGENPCKVLLVLPGLMSVGLIYFILCAEAALVPIKES